MVFVYGCAWALVDSVTFLAFMLMLAFVLPARFMRERFAIQGTGFVIILAPWLVFSRMLLVPILRFPDWLYTVYFVLVFFVILVLNFIVYRAEWLSKVLLAFAERLSVFLYLYLPLGVLGLVIVFLLNLIK